MLVSIISPSFNQGPYIRKMIKSVREQAKNVAIEHIILDNCSTDETVQALNDYRASPGEVDLRIMVKPDDGQTTAINEGFSLAKGNIICWLNTDEWYEPDTLASVVKFFAENPDVDVVFGGCHFVDDMGQLTKTKYEMFYSKNMLLYYGNFLPSCATFIRRSVFDNGLILDPQFRVTMDFDWYVRIADAGYKFAPIKQTLANFTWHESNISSVFIERRLIERKMVQNAHSSILLPKWIKYPIYDSIKWWWKGVRIIRNRVLVFNRR